MPFKVLLTGFGPFLNITDNPSMAIVNYLREQVFVNGLQLLTRILSVEYSEVDNVIPALWNSLSPDFVIHLGVGRGLTRIQIEQRGYVTGHCHPDIAEKVPCDGLCVLDEQSAKETSAEFLCTQVPVDHLVKICNELSTPDLKFSCSNDAGRYVCNYCFTKSLLIDPSRVLFVHVPDYDYPYSIEQMQTAIQLLIEVLYSQFSVNLNENIALNYRQNQRVKFRQRLGTIRYLGSLGDTDQPTGNSWLGIAWDSNPSSTQSTDFEPKLNGFHNGIGYFAPFHHNGGSFVRMETAEMKLDLGVGLVKALTEKYCSSENTEPIDVVLSGNKTVEAIGFADVAKTMSTTRQLAVIILDRQLISDMRLNDDQWTLLSSCRELSLRENLLGSWAELLAFADRLPNLRHLNVSGNRLLYDCYRWPSFAIKQLPLKQLIVNDCSLSWQQLALVVRHFTGLSQLSLAFNRLGPIGTGLSGDGYIQLTMINLELNDLSWEDVRQFLVKTPNLRELNLNDNPLGNIQLPNDQSEPFCWHLETLFLSRNNLTNLRAVSELGRLTQLKDLLCKDNFVHVAPLDLRQELIVRIPSLAILNRTSIDEKERKGAEYDFLRRYSEAYHTANETNSRKLFESEHPQFCQLVKRYGAPDEPTQSGTKSTKLSANLVKLNIQYKDRVLVKSVPKSMEINKLQSLLKTIFRIKEFTFYASSGQTRVEFDSPFKTVDSYELRDGDTIFVAD